uniref:Uncharacterized protein n=1 Tax=Hyaloperonospora arabidopsidis (strain Emoy2) TaxID=559515 RepID=M4BGD4_HYAAE
MLEGIPGGLKQGEAERRSFSALLVAVKVGSSRTPSQPYYPFDRQPQSALHF